LQSTQKTRVDYPNAATSDAVDVDAKVLWSVQGFSQRWVRLVRELWEAHDINLGFILWFVSVFGSTVSDQKKEKKEGRNQ